MTRTAQTRPCALKAIAVLCLAVAPLSSVAAQLGKSLGADPAATCAGLSGVRVDAMQVDAAALVGPVALSVAERGPTP